ncbi:MAG: alanine--tRNA ligase [Gemmatimonadetes bacterium]|nr:alanine--tRNA ligase [Gemmatimonadota bacterium]
MQAQHVRQSFVDFFRERGHAEVASSSLVPADDPTLLFTNSGMVQFKRVFQGLETRDENRAVTVQKCVRAGGKHNDLEQVGHTARHHTFFEMLGNFSFGDYFKRDAIAFAWEWVTSASYLGIDPDRVYVSVHESDDEARRLWHEVTGMDPSRIYGLGDADNFWQMGDTGPCGPCSEVFVDLGSRGSAAVPTLQQFIDLAEAGHLLEIWNLVFMQFDRAPDGSRSPLPAPSVDTGAGLERIAAVMQGVESNFDTDLFMPIINRAAEVIDTPYDRGPEGAGLRVLADHARAVAFLLADGVYPSSDGRGYVLRRILRRAVRHAYVLGRTEATVVHLAEVLIEHMGAVYPELVAKASHITEVTRAEEERFLETIEGGLRRLDELTAGAAATVAGEDAFKLYDTYGFPIDLTQIIAAERGWKVDTRGFDAALQRQQERSRSARSAAGVGEGVAIRTDKGTGDWTTVLDTEQQRFVGYDTTATQTDILKFRRSGEQLELVLHENPFYAESGGQVSDTGVVVGEKWELDVSDVHKLDGAQVVVGTLDAEFRPSLVHARVAEQRRRDIERNHTATHLVHAALRHVLGTHVRQAGSVVDPARLRFDFSHHAPMKDAELLAVEEEVNRAIWANTTVETSELPHKDALARGAMALFGEKYGDVVRVVDVPDVSVELCGGTHVRSTGQIGLFHFTGESGVAAGVRRIEAVTGPEAYATLRRLDVRLNEAADRLHTNPEHVSRKIEALLAEKRRLESQVEQLLKQGGGSGEEGVETMIGDTRLVVGDSPVDDRGQIGLLMDSFRERNNNSIKVLFATGDRPGIHVAVTDDLISNGVRAGDLVKRIAEVSGGRGGGRPHFASAGAGDASKLDQARSQTQAIVERLLAGSNSR